MKVQPQESKNAAAAPKKMSSEELKAKIKEKFGKDLSKPKAKPQIEDKVELNSKKGVTNSSEEGFGDIAKNDPKSEVTQNKLREILKTGAFQFNEKERSALSKILK